MKKPALILALGLLAPAMAAAQSYAVPGVVPLEIKGLPHSDVICVLQDNDGFLWLGTGEGLCRYDGLDLDIYRTIPGDSLSLNHNHIGSLALDGQGNIWIGTGLGVCVLDPRRLRFERKDLVSAIGRHSRYECYTVFRANDGTIWASTHFDGFARYDPQLHAFKEVECVTTAAEADPRPSAFGGTVQDEQGIFWIAEGKNLIRYDPTTDSAVSFPFRSAGQAPHPATLLTGVHMDPSDPNTLWLTSWGLGIVRFDKRTNSFTNTLLTTGKPANVSNIIWCCAPLGDGRFLVGIDSELRPFDLRTDQFGPTVVMNTTEQAPFTFGARAIYDDTHGQRWVGTARGLYIVPKTSARMELLGPGIVSGDALGGGYWGVSCYEHRQLRRMDEALQIIDSLPLPNADREGYEAFDLVQLRNGKVWLGTTKGLLVFDPMDRSFTWKPLTGLQGPGDRGPHVGALIEQPDGSVWANCTDHDLIRYRPATDDFVEANVPPGTPPNPHKLCYGIWPMDSDHLLLNYGEGFGVLDTRTMHVAEMMTTGTPGPGAQVLVSVVAHAHGELHAVSASNGVFVLRYTGDSLRITGHYEDATAGDTYFDAVADTLGNTWIASTSSLVRFRSSPPMFQHIGPRDGLSAGAADHVFLDQRHRILTCGYEFVRFDPGSIPLTMAPNAIYIRGVSVNGSARAMGLATDTTLALEHDENAVTIEYAPIALLNADQLHYEVRLDGSDAQWSDNGLQRTVSYIGLRPGTYSFHVRIVGNEATDARFNFSILPAWWQTWWFKVCATVLILVSLFLIARTIVNLRYRQRIASLERDREMTTLRTRIARDIHDDIGSGLTRITMLSREMNSTAEGALDKSRLASHIASASSDLIGQLSEIVWTVDPSNDHAERFVAFVRDLTGRQFEELPVRLSTDLSIAEGHEQRVIPPDVKRNVVLILKEALSNALKHAEARNVGVRMRIDATSLELDVRDDGHGFDASATNERGNGLRNLRKRGVSIGGSFELRSDGSGTHIHLRIPLPTPTIMRVP